MERRTTWNAIVTGGSSGIGLGFTRACAADNVNVCIGDIERTRAESAAVELSNLGSRVSAVEVDVADVVPVDAFARTAFETFERIDLVCCNAGILVSRPFLESTLADWNAILGVNLLGVVNTLRAFVPRMIEGAGARRVVIVASMSSLRHSGIGGQTLYTASKFAVHGMAEALAMELAADGVTLTVAYPGAVSTDIRVGSERRRPGSVDDKFSHPNSVRPEPVAAMSSAEAGRIIYEAAREGRRYVATHPEQWSQVSDVYNRIAAEGFQNS